MRPRRMDRVISPIPHLLLSSLASACVLALSCGENEQHRHPGKWSAGVTKIPVGAKQVSFSRSAARHAAPTGLLGTDLVVSNTPPSSLLDEPWRAHFVFGL